MNKTFLAVGGGILAIVVIMVLSIAGMYVSSYNTAVSYEKRIEKKWEDNQQILSQFYLKISEMAQVPLQYKNDFKEVVESSMTGRYGQDGSKATVQWLKEHDIKLPVELYRSVQDEISSGRTSFETNQRELLDIKRAYETKLGLFFTGTLMRMAGFPKIDLNKYNVVKTSEAVKAFETGMEKPRDIFGGNKNQQ